MVARQASAYPGYLREVENLVEQHLELEEEPLRLAIYYAPNRDKDDVFLFEVIDNFDGSSIETDGDLLEVLYGSTPGFELSNREARLHIILTSPDELRKAGANRTNRFQELKQAIAQHHAEIIYSDQQGDSLKQVFQ